MDADQAEKFFQEELEEKNLKSTFKIPKKDLLQADGESVPAAIVTANDKDSSPIFTGRKPFKRIRALLDGDDDEEEDSVAVAPNEGEFPKNSPTKTESESDGQPPAKFPRQSSVDFFSPVKGKDTSTKICHSPSATAISRDPLGLEASTYGEEKRRRLDVDSWQTLYSGELPEELLAKCGVAACHLCEVKLSSDSMANSHYQGKNHLKAVDAFLEYMATTTKKRVPRRMAEQLVTVDDKDERYCHLCQIALTSTIVALAHYNGKNHAKQQKKLTDGLLAAPQEQQKPMTVPSTSGNEVTVGQDQSREQNQESERKLVMDEKEEDFMRFFCLPCQVGCRTRDDYDLHVYSKAHKEKSFAQLQQHQQKPEFFCKICGVQCQDRAHFDSHLASADHQIKEIRGNVEKSQRENVVTRKDINPLVCNVCNITVTGPESMEMHLLGKPHKKELKKQENLGNVQAVNGRSKFFCDLCQIETSDLAGLECHKSGRKHKKKLTNSANAN